MKNKSKDQLLREMAMVKKQKDKLDKEKFIAKTVFPFVENLKTIYDAQTAFNAASGFVQYGLLAAEEKIKVSDLQMDLSKLKKDEVSAAVKQMIEACKDVDAKTTAVLLERMGQKLVEFVANKGLKEKMTIKTKDFVA